MNVRGRTQAAAVVLHGSTADEARRARQLARRYAPAPMVVAVDGGIRACRTGRVAVHLWVGDGDSAGGVPAGVEAVRYAPDKDHSDLSGALRECRARHVAVVVLAGLTGGRLDHEWANLHEAGARARQFAAILAPSERGLVVLTGKGCSVDTRPGETVSLLVLGGSATVTLRGTRWTLRRRRLRPGSTGLSNVTGRRLDLAVHAGVAALVFPESP